MTLIDFKKGKRNILIATSVASRGLDIQSIILVINFKCPTHIEDYIHRIGRTGRAGNKGSAITFFTQADENFAVPLEKILQMNNQNIPKQLEYIV
jgi:ATP-dependent RNA helicase DDX46/PRP5